MKVAAADAIAKLTREDVPDEVVAAMGGDRPHYGKDYIIPSTFDPRLISIIPAAVAKAAMDTGVARKNIDDFEVIKNNLNKDLIHLLQLCRVLILILKKIKKELFLQMVKTKILLKQQLHLKIQN